MCRTTVLTLVLAPPITVHAQSPTDVATPAVFSATGAFFALSVTRSRCQRAMVYGKVGTQSPAAVSPTMPATSFNSSVADPSA
jgi:hypothetical protein